MRLRNPEVVNGLTGKVIYWIIPLGLTAVIAWQNWNREDTKERITVATVSEGRFSSLSAEVAHNAQEIVAITNARNARADKVDAKINGLDSAVAAINVKLDKLEAGQDKILTRLDRIRDKMP